MATALFIQHTTTPRVVALQRRGETSFELARAMTIQFFEKQYTSSVRTSNTRPLEHGEHIIYHRYCAQFVRINDCVCVCILPNDGVREAGWQLLDAVTKFLVHVAGGKMPDVTFDGLVSKRQTELLLAFDELLWKGCDGVSNALSLTNTRLKETTSRRTANPSTVQANGSFRWQPEKPAFMYNITLEQLNKTDFQALVRDGGCVRPERDPDLEEVKRNRAFMVDPSEVVHVPRPKRENQKRKKKEETFDIGRQVNVTAVKNNPQSPGPNMPRTGSNPRLASNGPSSTAQPPSQQAQQQNGSKPPTAAQPQAAAAPAANGGGDDLFAFFADSTAPKASPSQTVQPTAQPTKPAPAAQNTNSGLDDFFGLGFGSTASTTSTTASSNRTSSNVDDLFLFGDVPSTSVSSPPPFTYPNGTLPFTIDVDETVQLQMSDQKCDHLSGEGTVSLRTVATDIPWDSWPDTLPSFSVLLKLSPDRISNVQPNAECVRNNPSMEGLELQIHSLKKSAVRSVGAKVALCTYRSGSAFREQPFKYKRELKRTGKSGIFMLEYILNPALLKGDAQVKEVSFALAVEGGPVSQAAGKPPPFSWNPQTKRFIWKVVGAEAARCQLFAKLAVDDADANTQPVKCVGVVGKFEIAQSSWSGLAVEVQDMGLQFSSAPVRTLRSGDAMRAKFVEEM